MVANEFVLGYINVSAARKEAFDEAIASFKIITR